MNTALLTTRWQSLPERKIRQLQVEKLRKYLRDVVIPFSPHYRELLLRHGFKAESLRSLDDLRRILPQHMRTQNLLRGLVHDQLHHRLARPSRQVVPHRREAGHVDIHRPHRGSFFLTYHRYAIAAQLLTCHPQLPEFLQTKRRFDPNEVFRSDWYRYYSSIGRDLAFA